MALFNIAGWNMSQNVYPIVEAKQKKRKRGNHGSIPVVEQEIISSTKKRNTTVARNTSKGADTDKLPRGDGFKLNNNEKSLVSKREQSSSPIHKNRNLTKMQTKMRSSLEGARFRWMNEKLYKSDSNNTHEMMIQDREMFEEYHAGFRRQVKSWPKNPVSYYISKLASYPKGTVIADLGCGDAALAKQLISKGLVVLSYDLISCNSFVVEADICDHIPLPGGDGDSDNEGQVVDFVICSLSLMSTNWLCCIREARRILKLGGNLEIAEVTSRLLNFEKFTGLISRIGFDLIAQDKTNTHFVLFTFAKKEQESLSSEEWEEILSRGDILRPCEYRKR